MGLLESIGRSGAVGQFGQNMFNNALQYGQFSQQSQESQMRQKIMDQKLAEQERMNRPVLLSELIGKGTEKGRPNVMKIFADAAKMAGAQKIVLPDGSEDYTITQADLPNVHKYMEMHKELHPLIQWATYQDNLRQIPELQKQREKAKTPAEQMQIDEQIEQMKAENAGILTEMAKARSEAPKRSLVKVNEGGVPVYRSQDEAEGMQAWERPLKEATGERRISVNALTAEENAALTRAISEKRLNPNKVNSRTAKIYAQMELENPGMSFSGKAADIEAHTKSLANQQKMRDMMASFVININEQIDRLKTVLNDVTRLDARLANVPIRKWATVVKGSAAESIVNMYLTEISNEIGKLSTGSAASIAELSEGAQKKWEKIHDPNLSIKDLINLLNETKHAGNLRIKSVDSVISETRRKLKGAGKTVNFDLDSGGGGDDPLGLGL